MRRGPRALVGPLLIGVVTLATIASLVALQLEANRQNGPVTASPASECSPQPCANALGYVMTVRSVAISPPLVRIVVTLAVHGQDNMHTAPEDFVLVDADRERSHPVFDAPGCANWPRTPIPDGQSAGPKTVCFRPASTRAPLTLSWEPDLGLMSQDFPVPLR